VGFDRSTDQGKVNELGEMEKVVSKSRTSSNAWCTGKCERLPEVKAVTSRIEAVTHIPKSHYESFQILQYSHNQFYRSHHDSSDTNKSPSGHRILTFFLYLSEVEEGGETHFNRLGISVKPKMGRALVWPSVLDANPDMSDNRMFHEAKDVIKGTKYAANHWIHAQDYELPNFWGCTGSFG
jgi:prolyl 4-hydroxylase